MTINYLQFDYDVFTNFYSDCTKEEIIDLVNTYKQSTITILADIKNTEDKSCKELQDVLHYHSCIFYYMGFQNLHHAFKEVELKCATETNLKNVWPQLTELTEKVEETVKVLEKEFDLNNVTS